jgi:PAS domain S-box-containing protein
MRRNEPPPAPEALEAAYAAALRDYVSGAGEAALTRAYELGRAAAGAGMGILELAMMHHGAIGALPPRAAADGRAVEMAAQFLAEALSPFEMALRSFQANARLLGLSETLARQNAEIDRARDQLRTILDATTAVIYLKDAQGRYLFVNRQFREVFGRAPEEVIGRTDEEVLPAPVARTLQGGDAGVLRARAPQQVEEVIPSAEGARTYVSLKFPLLDPDGHPYALCCVATDITARKRADEALLQAREALARERQLQRAVQARDQFITVASHELRTPLTSLELQVGSLRRLAGGDGSSAPVPHEKIRAKCDTILRQVERMTDLVNTLIDVGKVASGRLELCRERLDLADVARRAVAEWADATRRSGSELALRAAPVVGRWDRRSLEAAVGHVVANAVKFGAGRPIEISVLQAGGRAVLTVRDHGIGISREDQGRIFERFERAVSERHFGGFGVGLWVAREAVEANGGTIRVASREGDGAEFTLELPLEPALEPGGPPGLRLGPDRE